MINFTHLYRFGRVAEKPLGDFAFLANEQCQWMVNCVVTVVGSSSPQSLCLFHLVVTLVYECTDNGCVCWILWERF